MLNGFPELALDTIYGAKIVATLEDGGWFVTLPEEDNCMGCDFFCGIGLVFPKEQDSETGKRHGLLFCVLELFENSRRYKVPLGLSRDQGRGLN